MIHLYDRATMAHALTLDIDPRLRELLAESIAGLQTEYGDLIDHTEFLVVEPGDTEVEVMRHVGFSPLVDPIDGYRWPESRFAPGWDLLADRGGWFELKQTFGSAFGYVLLVQNAEGVSPELLRLCRSLASAGTK